MPRLIALVLAIIGIRLWVAPVNKVQISISIPNIFLKSDPKLKFHENQLISFLTAVRQELVSGITVNQAIANVVQDQPRELFVNSRHAGIDGSDQVTSLALDANQLDNASLQQLAKILSINRTSGASIMSALDIMIKAALTRQEQRQQIAAELSGVKATITVLALLPVVGTLMGLIMGVNVPYWLLTNPIGWLCLIFALLLETLGLLWVRHLIRGVS